MLGAAIGSRHHPRGPADKSGLPGISNLQKGTWCFRAKLCRMLADRRYCLRPQERGIMMMDLCQLISTLQMPLSDTLQSPTTAVSQYCQVEHRADVSVRAEDIKAGQCSLVRIQQTAGCVWSPQSQESILWKPSQEQLTLLREGLCQEYPLKVCSSLHGGYRAQIC